jgi:hypothetical protein
VFQDKIDRVDAYGLDETKLASCHLQGIMKQTGVAILSCPGLVPEFQPIPTKQKMKKGTALYSVQKAGGFVTLITGLYVKRAPYPLKGMFFAAGLNRPGMPLFDYLGGVVGLVIRPGVSPYDKTGVVVEIRAVIDGIDHRTDKKTRQGIHKTKRSPKSR